MVSKDDFFLMGHKHLRLADIKVSLESPNGAEYWIII